VSRKIHLIVALPSADDVVTVQRVDVVETVEGHNHSSHTPSHVEKTTTALERLPACLIGCGAVDRPEPGA
jgi:hypothetical protein